MGRWGKWNVKIARKFLLSKTHYFFPPRNLSPKLRQSKKLDVARFFIAIFFLEVLVRDQPGASYLQSLPSLKNLRGGAVVRLRLAGVTQLDHFK